MNETFIYGIHAVTALFANPHRTIQKLYLNPERGDQRLQTLIQQAEAAHIPIEHLTVSQMQQRFGTIVHQGIVAVANALPQYNERDLEYLLAHSKKPCLLLILDGITDPHNLGACLRCADAAGVDFVIIPKDKNATITPVVSKVACGAAETVPVVQVTNLVRAMETLKQHGIWLYGAAGEAPVSLYQLDSQISIALVMGAEGTGMRRLTREHCDGLFAIPMQGTVSSLNVSVATGIALYEIVRQRREN